MYTYYNIFKNIIFVNQNQTCPVFQSITQVSNALSKISILLAWMSNEAVEKCLGSAKKQGENEDEIKTDNKASIWTELLLLTKQWNKEDFIVFTFN